MQKQWASPAAVDERDLSDDRSLPRERARTCGSCTSAMCVLRRQRCWLPWPVSPTRSFRRFIKNASMYTDPLSVDQAGADQVAAQAAPAQSRPPDHGPGSNENPAADVDQVTSNEVSGCGLIMTEFTSADGLSRMRETKRKRYLTYYEDEHPISAQLFGSNPDTLADSALICQDAGFDLVDLNLGCPAKRVVACNGGSGLLRDLPAIERIFKRVRSDHFHSRSP